MAARANRESWLGLRGIDPASVQADNGAGLTRGIIRLVNQAGAVEPAPAATLRHRAGEPPGLVPLETEPRVDSKRVGIEGVSRYGKAALVAMAFEPRFAMVLVGSWRRRMPNSIGGTSAKR